MADTSGSQSAASPAASPCEELAVPETPDRDDGADLEPAPFPVPEDEEARMHLLRSLNVLGVQIEQFDPLVREAARLFATPISVISMVDVGRQWFVAKNGLDVDETERAAAFCGHAIMPQASIPFIVPDTHRDPRFRENPLVTGPPYIRFYCGMPIYVGGVKLGTVCVIDDRTRTFMRADFVRVVNALGQLSRLISRMLVRRVTIPHPMQSNLISPQPAQSGGPGGGGRQQMQIGEHMATTLDVPLSSIDVNSPLYRAFGLGGAPGSGLGAGADCWRNFGDADFAIMVGQLLELVDASYVQVVAAGTGDADTEEARVAEFRAQKGGRMVAKFDELWDSLEAKDPAAGPGEPRRPNDSSPAAMRDLMSGPSLFVQLAPRVVAWSRANDASDAEDAARAAARLRAQTLEDQQHPDQADE